MNSQSSVSFISSNKRQQKISNADLRDTYNALQPFTDKNVLKVFFALYELTVHDFDLFVSKEEIAVKCGLSPAVVEGALDKLPVQLCPDDKITV